MVIALCSAVLALLVSIPECMLDCMAKSVGAALKSKKKERVQNLRAVSGENTRSENTREKVCEKIGIVVFGFPSYRLKSYKASKNKTINLII
jgi:lauroyl/myristoyl acyltransferase